MVRRADVIQYAVAAVFSAAVVALLYVTGGGGDLHALNESLAAGTLFILGTVLLLGPLARMFNVFDWAFAYRKELGIMGFFTAALHVYLSMFPLARSGPWGLFRSVPLSAYTGLEALAILLILFVISNMAATRLLGARLWWQIQYWGMRATFILVAIHMIALKYGTILRWLVPANTGTATPGHAVPLIVWETDFILLVLVIRLSELFGKTAARYMTVAITAMLSLMMVWAVLLR